MFYTAIDIYISLYQDVDGLKVFILYQVEFCFPSCPLQLGLILNINKSKTSKTKVLFRRKVFILV